MDSKTQQQMAKMVDAVQPYCDDKIITAMTCSHAGSMSTTLFSRLLGGSLAPNRTSQLPNPVMIAVGQDNVYAFQYKPRGFKFKIKKEAARWSRKSVTVKGETAGMMATFDLIVGPEEVYPLEIPIAFGGRELARVFLETFTG